LRNLDINNSNSSPSLRNSYIYTILAIRLCNTIIKGTYTYSYARSSTYSYSSTHSRSYSSINSYNYSSTLLFNLSLADLKLALFITSSADLELRLGFSLKFSLMLKLRRGFIRLFFNLVIYIGSFPRLISMSLI